MSEDRQRSSKTAPGAYEAMLGLERYLKDCGLPERLMHLVKLRASQLNGCSFCIDMHARDARLAGESERRVHSVAGWEESPFFSEREKAALSWAEVVTRVGDTHAPDADWERLRKHFSEKEAADLTWLVAAINAWNRVAIAFRAPPPDHWPKLPTE
jgi:AhpD family alkylhydroperoxidase